MMMLKGLQGQAAEVLRAFQQDLLQQQQGPAPQEQMSSTEEITMDEVATPTGMQENIAMDRQTNVVNEMR